MSDTCGCGGGGGPTEEPPYHPSSSYHFQGGGGVRTPVDLPTPDSGLSILSTGQGDSSSAQQDRAPGRRPRRARGGFPVGLVVLIVIVYLLVRR